MSEAAALPDGPVMGGLSAVCSCGHTANFHRSLEQQAAYLAGSDGRYPGECEGGSTIHCRCITDRESVIAHRRHPDYRGEWRL